MRSEILKSWGLDPKSVQPRGQQVTKSLNSAFLVSHEDGLIQLTAYRGKLAKRRCFHSPSNLIHYSVNN